jgi:uncharacterized protein
MELLWNDQHLDLLPQKAIFWKEQQALILSDLHIGKITWFRKNGIPLPINAGIENVEKLQFLLANFPVKLVILTGDVFHNEMNLETEQFFEWRKLVPVPFILVRGNHDPLSFRHPDFEIYNEEFILDPFVFTHHPSDVADGRSYISGHVHPVFRLHGRGYISARLPCFYKFGDQLILPSFGYFTGGYEISPRPEERVFLISGSKVLDLSFPAE